MSDPGTGQSTGPPPNDGQGSTAGSSSPPPHTASIAGAASSSEAPPLSLGERLKKHKLVEWSLAYVAFAYAGLHGSQMLRETLGWSADVPRFTLFALLLGLPIAVTLAWYHGHKAQHRISGPELLIVSLLLALGGSVLWGFSFYREHRLEVASISQLAPSPVVVEKSIAVLPFLDMSEKHDEEYFAEGLSEELIDMLTKVPDLRVPARTSSFYFKDKPAPISEIAKALGVSHVLEGSVRKSGNELRITAQLVRADSGYHLWSETYDRKVDDIFKTQDDIAGAVVEALKVSLKAGSLAIKPTTNSEAYLLYMKGRYLEELGSEGDIRAAIDSLKHAVMLDSSYAPAWSELANCYVFLSGYVDAEPGEHMGLARDAVKRAIALNPGDASAHYSLAAILVSVDHNWRGALSEIDAGQRADPNLTEPGVFVWVRGCNAGPCHEKFIRDISRDIERDPLNAHAISARGWVYYYAGDLQAAEADLRHALVISPDLVLGKIGIIRVLIAQRRLDEAQQLLDAMPDSLYRRQGLAMLYFYQEKKKQADAALADLLARDSGDGPFEIAELYAVRGNITEAINWLERDYDERRIGIMEIKVDPLLKVLAHDPRYIALVRKIAPSEASNSR